MKFYYVYALYNKDKGFLYVGYSEDLLKRAKTHNDGKAKAIFLQHIQRGMSGL